MTIYRLAIDMYMNDLSGTGSKLFGGRWNIKGVPVLYTTENISLSVLEILVNTDKRYIPASYHLIKLEYAGLFSPTLISKEKLKPNWKDDFEYTQFIGTEFFKLKKSLLLKVPSAVVDEEYNYVFNTLHPDFKKVKIKSTSKFKFDNRLFLTNE